MPKYRDGWNDPPPTDTPKDFDVYGFGPTGTIHKPRRVWKRSLTAAACAAVIGLTYALLPVAMAVGGAVIGIWYVSARFYNWLDARTAD